MENVKSKGICNLAYCDTSESTGGASVTTGSTSGGSGAARQLNNVKGQLYKYY